MFISSLFFFHFLFHFSFHSLDSKPGCQLQMQDTAFHKCLSSTSLPNRNVLPKTTASKQLDNIGPLSDLTPIISRANTMHFSSSYFWFTSACAESKSSPSCLRGWLGCFPCWCFLTENFLLFLLRMGNMFLGLQKASVLGNGYEDLILMVHSGAAHPRTHLEWCMADAPRDGQPHSFFQCDRPL